MTFNHERLDADADRKLAALAGMLFLIATGAGVLAAALSAPILGSPIPGSAEALAQIAAHERTILLTALLQFIMGAACAGVGLALVPILKRYSLAAAAGAAGFRVIEGTLNIVAALGLVALLALAKDATTPGAPALAAMIDAVSEWLNNAAILLTWCIAALLYYVVFYQHRLVPRWLSAWGLIGIALASAGSLLVMFGLLPGFGGIQAAANLPIFVQELVFAGWLIARGVRHEAGAALRPALGLAD